MPTSTNPPARTAGHVLAFLVGVASFIGGIAGLFSSLPTVMGMTLLVVGLVLPVLAWRSLAYSRGGWSFMVSLLAILATVTFFGAPKIRHVLDIPLGVAFLLPAIMITAVVALAQVRADYR